MEKYSNSLCFQHKFTRLVVRDAAFFVELVEFTLSSPATPQHCSSRWRTPRKTQKKTFPRSCLAGLNDRVFILFNRISCLVAVCLCERKVNMLQRLHDSSSNWPDKKIPKREKNQRNQKELYAKMVYRANLIWYLLRDKICAALIQRWNWAHTRKKSTRGDFENKKPKIYDSTQWSKVCDRRNEEKIPLARFMQKCAFSHTASQIYEIKFSACIYAAAQRASKCELTNKKVEKWYSQRENSNKIMSSD